MKTPPHLVDEERADGLLPHLGGFDRQRMERHFDQIRDFERRLAEGPPTTGSSDCQSLPVPWCGSNR